MVNRVMARGWIKMVIVSDCLSMESWRKIAEGGFLE